MIKNFKSFSKIIVYLLAVCRSISAQYGKFSCEKVTDKKSTTICTLHSNQNSILPIEDIPGDTESLIVDTFGNGSLAITRVDIFQNFHKLKNLKIRIGSSLHIAETLLDSVSTKYLQNLLFDVPNLKTLSIRYNQFNDENYSWILPANLEKLYLSNGIFEFNFRNLSALVFVQLSRNKLRKIPWSEDQSPALEILDLRKNPMNEFSVDDIAELCHLRYYAMDISEISNCECNKLNQWIVKLREWGDFTFHGNLNCSHTRESNSNCTLEEAMRRREKKCSTWWNRNKVWILMAAGEGGGVLGLFILLCCCCCFGYCVIFCFWVTWMIVEQHPTPPLVSRELSPY